MIDPPGTILGLRAIEDPSMTEPGDPVAVKRTWRERLFTVPWKPLARTKTVIPQVPSEKFIRAEGCIIAHPATIAKAREMARRQR